MRSAIIRNGKQRRRDVQLLEIFYVKLKFGCSGTELCTHTPLLSSMSALFIRVTFSSDPSSHLFFIKV